MVEENKKMDNPIRVKVKYSRIAEIEAYPMIKSCDNCKVEDVPGFYIDTSGEEYGPVYICFDCIKELMNLLK